MCHALLFLFFGIYVVVQLVYILPVFSDVIESYFLAHPLLFSCTCLVCIFLVVSSISSPYCRSRFFSDEGCHWFNVSFSPDVFILYVDLICLASSPSQHSHLSGVQFLGIFVLNCSAFKHVCHCWRYRG